MRTNDPNPQPFSLVPSPGFHHLLQSLDCSVALSTYEAGKVIMVGHTVQGLTQLPRTFNKPMGMAVDNHRMAVATRDQILVLGKSERLAIDYPKSPGKYDALWVPRAAYFCGEVDVHDMCWGDEGLWAVNTRFSCLSLVTDEYSFQPMWQPPFVTELQPEDRCHLNGLAMEDGRPAYVTMLGEANEEKGWRQQKADGGLLMEVASNAVVTGGLSMPHSPRIIDGRLLVLNSGTGEVLEVDRKTGQTQQIIELPGFLRGCSYVGGYLFVGLSQLRDKRSFGGLPLEETGKELQSGVAVINLATGKLEETLYYQSTVQEIYDVKVLESSRQPGVLAFDPSAAGESLVLPDNAFWAERGPKKHAQGERFEDYESTEKGWR